ncbi:uncharacterized protein J7T54_003940 [Emericellopsis cladophorae]|uniref:CCHC-type domain-containing protein n=1 Tax=Emericellopsis cladophorae TaxID=2686198 RepID=A0A9P9Y185_9HYPO|nr:uncharacterized protein J7T54_003940 [Emericellopsis cladophorae]KAI6781674.1 hypothetical protein J7T54_003940 [Emericellopsis cladophorae]
MASKDADFGDVIAIDSSSGEEEPAKSQLAMKKRSLRNSNLSEPPRESKRLKKNAESAARGQDDMAAGDDLMLAEESERDAAEESEQPADQTKLTNKEKKEQRKELNEGKSDFDPIILDDPPIYVIRGLAVELPAYRKFKGGNAHTWEQKVPQWIDLCCRMNAAMLPGLTVEDLLSGHAEYINTVKDKGSKGAKRRLKQVITASKKNTAFKNKFTRSWPELGTDVDRTDKSPSRFYEYKSEAQDNNGASVANGQGPVPSSASAPIELEDDSEAEYEPTFHTEQPIQALGSASVANPTSSPPNGHQEPNGDENHTRDYDTSDLQQQQTYFPSASDPSNMCLSCGQEGHSRSRCPHSICRFCNGGGHWDFACPSRVRCGKCRQQGHTKAECQEKLALTKSEGLACGFCNSTDHLEENCTEIWRSFAPRQGKTNKVVFIAPSCSLCGSDKHYRMECASRKVTDKGNPTWSLANCNLYIEKDCGQRAIEHEAAQDANKGAARRQEVRIKGHAARSGNIVHYSDDEDSEVEFLGKKPAQRRAPLGNIRMASNIQMPAQPVDSFRGRLAGTMGLRLQELEEEGAEVDAVGEVQGEVVVVVVGEAGDEGGTERLGGNVQYRVAF